MFLSLISFYHDRKLISWRNFSRIIEKWTRNILVSNGWRQTRCEGKGRGSEGSGIGRSEIWFPILLSCGKSLWEKVQISFDLGWTSSDEYFPRVSWYTFCCKFGNLMFHNFSILAMVAEKLHVSYFWHLNINSLFRISF